MRECLRVLRPGGVLAGTVIHCPAGLGDADEERAADHGPSFVRGFERPGRIATEAGFAGFEVRDVSERFRETSIAWGDAFTACEAELRAELGDEEYQDEVERKGSMLAGIEQGLLVRSLVACWKA